MQHAYHPCNLQVWHRFLFAAKYCGLVLSGAMIKCELGSVNGQCAAPISLNIFMRIDEVLNESSGQLPSYEEVVTKEWVDQIVKTKHWVYHGSHIERYLEDKGLSFDSDEELRDHLVNEWLPKRYRYVINDLQTQLNKFDTMSRCLVFSEYDWKRLKDKIKTSYLGRYWSTYNPACYTQYSKAEKPIEVYVTAKLEPEKVNWVETIRSRMDYDNGDDEAEIQIHNGAKPEVVDIKVVDRS